MGDQAVGRRTKYLLSPRGSDGVLFFTSAMEESLAYGNWGAFVYRDNERMRAHEDATPYHEHDLPPGYWQAFARDATEFGGVPLAAKPDPHHAVLGSGSVRLCGYKSSAALYLNGERMSYDNFNSSFRSADSDDDCVTWLGEVDGHVFRADRILGDGPERIELMLLEPSGARWTAVSGYQIGAGHDE